MRYLIHIMEKIEGITENDKSSQLYKASLSLLFVNILPNIKQVPMADILLANLMKLAILSNLQALQYATLNKILEFVKQNEPKDEDLQKVIEIASKAL